MSANRHLLLIALALVACGDANIPNPADVSPLEEDGGTFDASAPDTSSADTGAPDTGKADTGTPDAGMPDSGAPDSGTPDGGTPDAGTFDAAACGPTVSFAAQIQPIFEGSCTNCHPNGGALDLRSGHSYANLVNKPTAACSGARTRVIPGDVDNSYLVNKVTSTNMCSGGGMPLSSKGSALIAAWICQGALNN